MKLTEAQRRQLGQDVLRALTQSSNPATYVIRNMLDWPGEGWHRTGLKTSDVLRACRRLEARGHVDEVLSSYMVMKTWRITDAGHAALKEAKQ